MAAVAGTTAKKKMRMGVKIALHSVGAGCLLCGAFLGASVWDLNRRVSRAAKCLSDESSVERSRYIVPPDSVAAALSAAQRDPGEPRSLSYRKWSQFPFVLLRLAQCDNRKLKQLAFRRLLNSKAMTNADFCQIAQSANFKTLLELARFSDADPRFFLQPRQPNYAAARGGYASHFDDYGHSDLSLESFEERLRDLLKMLLTVDDLPPIQLQQPQLSHQSEAVEFSQSVPWYNFATSFLSASSGPSSTTNANVSQNSERTSKSKPGQCRCCRYRTQLALDRTEPENHFLEHEGFVGTELPDASRRDPLSNEEARIAVLLEALRVQSAHSDRARRMMNANTTLVLRDLLLATDSAELHRVVARIVLNLTAAFRCARDESGMRELVRHIAEGRWLSILHHWFRERDPYLSLYAANALTNLHAVATHLDVDTASDLKDRYHATVTSRDASKSVVNLYRDGLYLLHPLHSTLNDLDSSVSFRDDVTSRATKWLRGTLAKFGFKVHLAMVHASSTAPPINGDADIVFVHGLLGGVLRTWRARECADLHKNVQQLESVNVQLSATERGDAVPSSDAAFELHAAANPEAEAGGKRFWRRNTPCWPKDWLPTDLPNVRVIGLDYDTNLSRWQRACPYDEDRNTLEARAATILKQLQRAGVGRDRPVIWISHSLGGLLVKQILVLASKRRVSENGYCESLVRNTKGCVFYAVPHLGTDFAKQFTRYNMLLSLTTEVEQLSSDSRHLDTLNAEFRKLILKEDIAQIGTSDASSQQRLAGDSKPNILSFVERDELALWKYKALIVPKHTADGGLGGEHLLVPEDHQRVCKPASPDSPNYVEVVRFIKKCLLLQ